MSFGLVAVIIEAIALMSIIGLIIMNNMQISDLFLILFIKIN